MYNPPAPTNDEQAAGHTDNDAFEFVELTNRGSETIDLDGYRVDGGIRFTFGAFTLGPGESVLIVTDEDAFARRYGTADNLVVAGRYSGHLSNGGEGITLLSPIDMVILDFAYSDDWYPNTDGGGRSLEVVDPDADVEEWGSRSHWRESAHALGSPGIVP